MRAMTRARCFAVACLLPCAAVAAEPARPRCSPAAWLAPASFCPQNPFAPPFSCAVPRACWPCRVETTHDGDASPVQEESWRFDERGRLLRSTSRIGKKTTQIACTYAEDGTSATCARDDRPSTLSYRGGRVATWTEGSDVTRFTWNARGQLKRVVLTQEGAVTSDVTREYGAGGRIDWEADAPGEGVEMKYDAAGRFVRATRLAKDKSRTSQREVTWSADGRTATERDESQVSTWSFGDDGRVTSVAFHPQPGVAGATGVTRYVYECPDEPAK